MKPILSSFTQFGVQQLISKFWKDINKLIKYFYPLRQVAGGFIGDDGTVYSSFGLRSVDPVSKVGTGLYDIYTTSYMDYQEVVILVSTIGLGQVLRSTSYSIKNAPNNNGIQVQIVGQDTFDAAIVNKDTAFEFMIWEIRG